MFNADNPLWLPPLVEAISVLSLLLSQSEIQDEAIQIHQQEKITQNPIFCAPTSSMVCQSFIIYHQSHIDSILGSSRYYDGSHVSADFWILAGACHGGCVDLVRKAIEYVQLHYTEDWKAHASKFLGSVIRNGKEEVIRLLISLGVGANTGTCSDMTAFVAATYYGRLDILRVLFEPQYRLSIDTERNFTYAISDVALNTDPMVRLETVQFLLAQAGHLLSDEARNEVFYIACCYNDAVLAKLMLAKGHVDIYNYRPYNTELSGCSRWMALEVVVERGSLECLRVILQNKFTPDRHEDTGCFCRNRMWDIIYRNNRLDVFKEMLPYMDERCCDAETLYIRGAQIQGGISVVEKLRGPLDKNKLWREEKLSLGIAALYLAATRAVSDNVEHLLREGVRSEDEILIHHGQYDKYKDRYDKIDKLLMKFNNPGLKRIDREEIHPPVWYLEYPYPLYHINPEVAVE